MRTPAFSVSTSILHTDTCEYCVNECDALARVGNVMGFCLGSVQFTALVLSARVSPKIRILIIVSHT